MSIKHMLARAHRIEKVIFPRPKIIHCEQAKDELLMMLEMQMTYDEEEILEWTEEQKTFADKLDTFLDESVKQIEETCNVRLV